MRKESKFLPSLAFAAVLGMVFFMASSSYQVNNMSNHVSQSVLPTHINLLKACFLTTDGFFLN